MPIDVELLQKIERQRQRLEDGVRPAKLVEGFVASPAKKDVSFTATTPPSSQELSSSFVTPSSRSSSSTPELRSYRLTEGRCEALDSVHPWALDLEDKEVKTPVHEDDSAPHTLMQHLWQMNETEVQMDSSQASLAATAQLRLGAVIEGSASRDLSPVDETKVMAWRPKCRRARGKGILGKSGTQHSTGLQPRPAWSNLSKPEAKKTPQVAAARHRRGATSPDKSSTELQLRRLSKELAAEGQRFRQQGKLCFEMAVRAEALHSEVRIRQQHATKEREAKLIRAAGRLQKAQVISA